MASFGDEQPILEETQHPLITLLLDPHGAVDSSVAPPNALPSSSGLDLDKTCIISNRKARQRRMPLTSNQGTVGNSYGAFTSTSRDGLRNQGARETSALPYQ